MCRVLRHESIDRSIYVEATLLADVVIFIKETKMKREGRKIILLGNAVNNKMRPTTYKKRNIIEGASSSTEKESDRIILIFEHIKYFG